jgi:hypothetical protein
MGWYEKYKCIKLLTTMTIMNVCYDWKNMSMLRLSSQKCEFVLKYERLKLCFILLLKNDLFMCMI